MDKEKAFTKIISDNEGIIYKITRLYTDNVADQKDLYQEIVFQLWKGFDGFRGDSKISTWMYRIALNTALYHSKLKKRKGHSITLDGIILKEEHYDPVWEERVKALYDQIKLLDELDKANILLFLEGKKHSEIAIILGISVTNVGTRIGRIKEKLKIRILKD